MPTTVSRQELDELRALINEHLETTGESVTSIAKRAGVGRSVVSNLANGSYRSSPSLEVASMVASAIGKRISWVDE